MAINRQQALALPAQLKDPLSESWEAFVGVIKEAQLPLPKDPDFTTSMLRVWACSDFVTHTCLREPDILFGLLESGDLLADYARGGHRRKLAAFLNGIKDEGMLANGLRIFRKQEMLRIAWRDLAGWSSLDETLHDLSALADASIAEALEHLSHWAVQQLGASTKSLTPSLVVLGMGKLGARELNFSSDVDLIFAYPDAEKGWKRRRLSPDEFYLRLGQQLIRMLDNTTEDGFVFRVDMRLRPYGDSGPLVTSFDAMADYYQLQGREWERYAMIKARPVAGPDKAAKQLMKLLRPFVYRRYLDFGAFESLRNLKEQIAAEVERKGMQDNIKLGPGGIREIEFIAQAFQLVRGGRQPMLQQRGVLEILDALAVLGYLPAHTSMQLAEAYVFLRRTENRLQAFDDQQVHELPKDDIGKIRLAFAMGYPDWEAFEAELQSQRQFVQAQFEELFAAPPEADSQVTGKKTADLGAVWKDILDDEDAEQALADAGFLKPGEVMQWLATFREGAVNRFLGDQGQQRLDALMPLLLNEVAASSDPMPVLRRLGELLEAISGRTTYLSLLVEHPMALSQLTRLCAASPWLSSELAQHPILLDELLDPRTLYSPLDKAGLRGALDLRLAGVAADDLEQQMDRVRQFKQASVLHVAATDIVSGLPVQRVGDNLTCIAEVVLEKVLKLAWNSLAARHGQPCYEVRGQVREARFGIIGYGKLGGLELGYGSDLDIVFLHDSCGENQRTSGPKVVDNSEFFTRLSQRIIHFLNTFTPAGVLYEVDMRLRPNGDSGLLVTSVEAFAEYQRRSAWNWEYQALVRARMVLGDTDISRQFERVRSGVLAKPRDAKKLRDDVTEMRQRMREELDKSRDDRIDLKHGRGGIVDIEFMVQFMVLRWSCEHAELLRYTDNVRLLETIMGAGLLPEQDARCLSDAYLVLRQRVNQLALQDEAPLVTADEFVEQREAVAAIWDRVLAGK